MFELFWEFLTWIPSDPSRVLQGLPWLSESPPGAFPKFCPEALGFLQTSFMFQFLFLFSRLFFSVFHCFSGRRGATQKCRPQGAQAEGPPNRGSHQTGVPWRRSQWTNPWQDFKSKFWKGCRAKKGMKRHTKSSSRGESVGGVTIKRGSPSDVQDVRRGREGGGTIPRLGLRMLKLIPEEISAELRTLR